MLPSKVFDPKNMSRALDIVVIKPNHSGMLSKFKGVRAAQYMFWNLTKSSALAPYAEIALGFFWTFIRPFIFLSVIVFVRKQSNAQMGEQIEYVLFVYSGLILWWYFVDATKQSARCFYKYRGLVTKVYYPRIITPAVPVFARLFDLALQLLAILPLMIYFDHYPDWHFVLLPLVIFHAMIVALGLGYIFSVLGSLLKDFERMLDFLLYVAFFISPVIFSARIIPDQFHPLYALINPMVVPLEMVRTVLFSGGLVNINVWLASMGMSFAILIAGLLFFSRFEDLIAEKVS